MNLSEFDKGWLTALIDSEGHISKGYSSMSKQYGTIQYQYASIRITNTCIDFLKKAQELCSGTIRLRKSGGGHLGKKPCYDLTISGKTIVKDILETLLAYFIVKKIIATEAIECIRKREATTNYPWNRGRSKETDPRLAKWSIERRGRFPAWKKTKWLDFEVLAKEWVEKGRPPLYRFWQAKFGWFPGGIEYRKMKACAEKFGDGIIEVLEEVAKK